MATDVSGALHQLRQQLKAWEKSFAATHGGRKATKADIKEDPAIAAKYRQYDQLSRPDRKRKSTPQKPRSLPPSLTCQSQSQPQPQVASTPSRASTHRPKLPARALSPTPQAIRRRLGPTPQKDGQIIGLFDDPLSCTPSRPRIALSTLDANAVATPSRADGTGRAQLEALEDGKLSRTPTSSGKRYMLDTFATPRKRKQDEGITTPSSRRGVDSTPQFLRRSHTLFQQELQSLAEQDEGHDSQAENPPFKKRNLVRSLSSIIKGMKQQFEDEADENLDLLREMESGDAPPRPGTTELSSAKAAGPGRSDSPVERMPDKVMQLGPDTLPTSDDDDDGAEDQVGQDGRPRKVWKKKGLKRQTRRVIMRPVRRPAGPATTAEQIVAETQFEEASLDTELPEEGDSEYDDDDDDDRAASRPGKMAPVPAHVQKADGGPKKRKVSELAHANFCKLKIKNKNSKAKGRGRFGRR